MPPTHPFPQPRTCPCQPAPGYEALRAGPALQRVTLSDGRVAWLVVRYAEARAVLADPRVSAGRGQTDCSTPDYNRHRRMLIPEFTSSRVTEMTPYVERVVAETLDRILAQGPPADLVTGFALPVALSVIGEMVGVPHTDREFLRCASRRMSRAGEPDEMVATSRELAAYFVRLTADPPPGMLARLTREGTLSEEQLAGTAVMLLAGHQTTAAALCLGVVTLLEHPAQLVAFQSSPQAAANGVDEILRYVSVLDCAPQRFAVEDIEIGGTVIKADEEIIVAGALVNRDPDAFDGDPDAFDVSQSSRHHLAFGFGVHQCIGENLARLTLRIALSALFERIPSLRLAVPASGMGLRPPLAVQGVYELPVTW